MSFKMSKSSPSLVLDDNNLKEFPKGLFRNLDHLKQLHAPRNQFVSITFEMVADLTLLEVLNLNENRLTELDDDVFQSLPSLRGLVLRGNPLERLPQNMFEDIAKSDNIQYINLRHCALRKIPNIPFMRTLRYLQIEGNPLTGIDENTFSTVNLQTEFSVGQHEICECYLNKNAICIASDDRSPYLTCDRLLADRVLVVLMWLIGLNAIGGNVFVLGMKVLKSDGNTIQNILLGNLALSDLLMGIYMIIIASADVYFGDYFPMSAESWRRGTTCKISGSYFDYS